MKVEISTNKREIYSLIGQVNFLRRFIPRFVEIFINVTNTLRKDYEIKWTIEAKKYFNDIKKEIIEEHVLVILDFLKTLLFSLFVLSTL